MNINHDDIAREVRSTRRLALAFTAVALLLKLALVGALIWGGAALVMQFVD